MTAPGKKPYLLLLSNTVGFRIESIARGLIEGCHAQGLSLLWKTYDGFELKGLRGKPAGVVVNGSPNEVRKVIRQIGRTTPVVSTIGNTLRMPVPTIYPDYASISEKAVDHLLDEGVRNIILVGPRRSPLTNLAVRVCRATLKRRLRRRFHFSLLAVPAADKFWAPDRETGKRLLRFLGETRAASGIVAMSDPLAVSCIECIESAGFRVPGDVAVVGMGDYPFFNSLYLPLTSVRIDFEEIGRLAVQMLVERRSGSAGEEACWERRTVAGELIVRDSSRRRLQDDPAIAEALRYLHANFGKKIRLEDLAREARMSRSNFIVRFRRAVGESAIAYLLSYRVDQAKRMLIETDGSVSEIAYQAGFSFPQYFNRAFKNQTGMTPRAYRLSRQRVGGRARTSRGGANVRSRGIRRKKVQKRTKNLHAIV